VPETIGFVIEPLGKVMIPRSYVFYLINGMHAETTRTLHRTRRFGAAAIKFARTLPKDPAGFSLARQLIRSATSIGANFREAQRARTRNEFVSKLTIALQEAEEARYWLELLVESELASSETVQPMLDEVSEFVAILVATIRTSKGQRAHAR